MKTGEHCLFDLITNSVHICQKISEIIKDVMKKKTAKLFLMFLIFNIASSLIASAQKDRNWLKEALLNLVSQYKRCKEYSSAIQVLNALDKIGYERSCIELAEMYYLEGQVSRSKELFKMASDNGSGTAFIIVCVLENREKDAHVYLNKQVKGAQATLCYDAAMILRSIKYTQVAIDLFLQAKRAAAKVKGEYSSFIEQYSHFQLGFTFAKINDFEKAERYYKMAIEAGEKYLSPAALAKLCRDQNRFKDAEAYYTMSLNIMDNPYVWIDFAHLYYLQGKYDRVEQCLESSTSLVSEQRERDISPKDIKKKIKERDLFRAKRNALNGVGLAYAIQGEFEKAIQYFKEAICCQEDYNSLFNLADIYLKLEQFDLAEDYGKRAVAYAESSDDEGMIYTTLGLTYDLQGKSELAKENFARGFEKGNGFAAYEMGKIYLKEDKYDLAEECLKKAIEGEVPEAGRVLGNVYDLQNKLHLASIFYKYAVDSGDESALHQLGAVYVLLKKLDLAEPFLKKALKNGDKSALFTLGKLFFGRRDLDQAERYYKQALKEGLPGAQGYIDLVEKLKENPEQAEAGFNKMQREGLIP